MYEVITVNLRAKVTTRGKYETRESADKRFEQLISSARPAHFTHIVCGRSQYFRSANKSREYWI